MNACGRRAAVACALLVACAGLSVLPALGADIIAATPQTHPSAVWPQHVIYALVLNGAPVSSGTTFLQLANQTLLVKSDDLKLWRLKAQGLNPTLIYRGEAYYSFAALGVTKVRVDPLMQQIELTLPAAMFEATAVSGMQRSLLRPTRAGGAFINYDFYSQGSNFGQHFANGFFSAGITGAQGVLLFRTLATLVPSPQLTRLDTVWQRDDPSKRSTLLAGDAISAAGNLGSAVRFAGIQIASNFATDPSFLTFPSPVLGGQAALPSTVSVYVNDAQTLSEPLPPGPFTISNIPVVTGGGQIQLAVRDLLGRTVTISQPYYVSPQLLKRGLSAYSYEAGFARANYGLRSNDYGRFIASVTNRFGVTDRFTDELHAEFGSGRALASASGHWALGSWGVGGLGIAASSSQSGAGNSGEFDYAYQSRRFNTSVRFQANSLNYTTLATQPQLQPIRQVQLQAGGAVARHGYVSAAYTEQQTVQSGTIKITALNASLTLHRGSLSVSAIHTVSAISATELQLFYSLPLDASRLLSLSSSVRGGAVTTTTELSQNLPASGIGFGFRSDQSAGANAGSALSLTQQDDRGTRTLALNHVAGMQIYSATISGALSFFGHRAFASRSINDAYGLVRLASYPGVRVLVNGTEQGKTDADGMVVLSDLSSYQSNNVTLESNDLPLLANIPNTTVSVVPYAHSSVALEFPSAPAGGVLFSVVTAEGKTMAAGTVVKLGAKSWQVADDGSVFVFGLEPGPYVLQIAQEHGFCTLAIQVPAESKTIPDLGRVVCK